MQGFMTCFTEGDEVIWSIAANTSAFQVVYMKFGAFFMFTTCLAGVCISMQDVLSQVVVTELLSFLVVGAFWQWITILYCFQELEIELCCFDDDFGYWEQLQHALDTCDMFLDLYFD